MKQLPHACTNSFCRAKPHVHGFHSQFFPRQALRLASRRLFGTVVDRTKFRSAKFCRSCELHRRVILRMFMIQLYQL